MTINENEVEFNYSARYFTNQIDFSEAKAIWYVFHGYGQLAFYFLRKFEILSKYKILVVAPEGLSRYYLNDTKGRVGATWMTKEDRERDILNYTRYFETVFRVTQSQLPNWIPTTLLGFSQGAATVCRCASSPLIQFDRMILWAGLFPFDLDPVKGKSVFNDKQVDFVYGTQDPYLSDERFMELEKLSGQFEVTLNKYSFNGVHDIDNHMLEALAN